MSPERATTRCADCGGEFRCKTTGSTFDGAVARYRCPLCGHWTRGPTPDNWAAKSDAD